jgi:dethiobiotin synthetase
MLSVFISGFESQTGKTIVTAGLAATMQSLSYSTNVYKPICMNSESVSWLEFIKKVDSNISTEVSYVLKSNLSPFVGAYEEGLNIDVNTIFSTYQACAQIKDCNLIEGTNCISTPVARNMTEIEIVKMLKLPLVMVVNPKKTSIDKVISGLRYIQSERVEFLGVIINCFDENSENLEEKYFAEILKEFTDVKILGYLPDYGDISTLAPETLIADVLNNIDIEKVFGLKIAKLNA